MRFIDFSPDTNRKECSLSARLAKRHAPGGVLPCLTQVLPKVYPRCSQVQTAALSMATLWEGYACTMRKDIERL